MAAEVSAAVRFIVPDALPDVEETGQTFAENAAIKARSVAPVAGSALVLADDSGLIIDVLAGYGGMDLFPGVYSSRWLTPARCHEIFGEVFGRAMGTEISEADKNAAVLRLMAGQQNRNARYVCAMALYEPATGHLESLTGVCELLVIAGEPRGSGGFGYDPIVTPVGGQQTMAELDICEKNRISHRGEAFRRLLAYLKSRS